MTAKAQSHGARNERFPDVGNLREDDTPDIRAQNTARKPYSLFIDHEISRESIAANKTRRASPIKTASKLSAMPRTLGAYAAEMKLAIVKAATNAQAIATICQRGSYGYRAGRYIVRRLAGGEIGDGPTTPCYLLGTVSAGQVPREPLEGSRQFRVLDVPEDRPVSSSPSIPTAAKNLLDPASRGRAAGLHPGEALIGLEDQPPSYEVSNFRVVRAGPMELTDHFDWDCGARGKFGDSCCTGHPVDDLDDTLGRWAINSGEML